MRNNQEKVASIPRAISHHWNTLKPTSLRMIHSHLPYLVEPATQQDFVAIKTSFGFHGWIPVNSEILTSSKEDASGRWVKGSELTEGDYVAIHCSNNHVLSGGESVRCLDGSNLNSNISPELIHWISNKFIDKEINADRCQKFTFFNSKLNGVLNYDEAFLESQSNKWLAAKPGEKIPYIAHFFSHSEAAIFLSTIIGRLGYFENNILLIRVNNDTIADDLRQYFWRYFQILAGIEGDSITFFSQGNSLACLKMIGAYNQRTQLPQLETEDDKEAPFTMDFYPFLYEESNALRKTILQSSAPQKFQAIKSITELLLKFDYHFKAINLQLMQFQPQLQDSSLFKRIWFHTHHNCVLDRIVSVSEVFKLESVNMHYDSDFFPVKSFILR